MYAQLFTCFIILKLATPFPQERNDAAFTFSGEQVRQLRQSLSFRPTTVSYEDDDDHVPSPSQNGLTRTPSYDDENFLTRNAIPVSHQRSQIPKSQLSGARKQSSFPQIYRQQLEEEVKTGSLDEKEKEIEEPDRLTLLLPQSKFDCSDKKTGYYADDGLGCEVFHYCQSSAKHSWICPEGFTFHQVHLICMPPGQDNICEQSPQFHFVNEFLYKPINLEEHQTRPNITLRYSDRYYPSNSQFIYQNDQSEESEQGAHQVQPGRAYQQQPQVQRAPIQRRPAPSPFATAIRSDPAINQVFRSAEEVNISLQQRRPTLTSRYLGNEDY